MALSAVCDDEGVHVRFDDGREIDAPLLEFLRRATPAQRRDCRVEDSGAAIYWPQLDEYAGVDWILGVSEDEVLALAGYRREGSVTRR